MENIQGMLKERANMLKKLKKEKEKSLQTAPEGYLRIGKNKDRVQYYHRTNPKDFTGKYLTKGEKELAQILAQKDYDKKVLNSAEKELDAIEKYFSKIPVASAEELYDALHEERKKLVVPIIEPMEEFAEEWQNVQYKGKEFDEDVPEIYTAKGERVRSKSEVIIADSLYAAGIPYRYEFPLKLKSRTIYPDFTILNIETRKEIYWEHLGMMDHPEYLEHALKKIAGYEENGLFPGEDIILTFETQKTPINRKVVHLMIERYLKKV